MTEKNRVVANQIAIFGEEVAKQAFFLNDPEILIAYFNEKGIDLTPILIQSTYSHGRGITSDLAEIQVELLQHIDKVPTENQENFINNIVTDSVLLHDSRDYGNLKVAEELLNSINLNMNNNNSYQRTM